MALIECKECGNQVSTKAESCPSCGAAIVGAKKTLGVVFKYIFGILLGLGLALIIYYYLRTTRVLIL